MEQRTDEEIKYFLRTLIADYTERIYQTLDPRNSAEERVKLQMIAANALMEEAVEYIKNQQ
jgi:hypothetical protein